MKANDVLDRLLLYRDEETCFLRHGIAVEERLGAGDFVGRCWSDEHGLRGFVSVEVGTNCLSKLLRLGGCFAEEGF